VRTCTCFASSSQLHHRGRASGNVGRFDTLLEADLEFYLVLRRVSRVLRADSFKFFQDGMRDQAPRAFVTLAAAAARAREKKVEPQIVLYCGKLTDDRYRKPEIISLSNCVLTDNMRVLSFLDREKCLSPYFESFITPPNNNICNAIFYSIYSTSVSSYRFYNLRVIVLEKLNHKLELSEIELTHLPLLKSLSQLNLAHKFYIVTTRVHMHTL